MFTAKMGPEPIPERVYALCKLLEKGPLSVDNLKDKMEPSFLDNKTAYFREYRQAAEELGLITIDGNIAKLAVDTEVIKTTESMRKFINSRIYMYERGNFYQVTSTYFSENMKSLSLKHVVSLATESQEFIKLSVDAKEMRGWRFWFAFLGFGYIHDVTPAGLSVLPSCETFLWDLIEKTGFEKNKKYTITEFLNMLQPNIGIVIDLKEHNKKLNYGLSNGLRVLEHYEFIKLENILDEHDIWNLYNIKLNSNTAITHITVCK